MKKLFLGIFLFIITVGYSQTKTEKSQITNQYKIDDFTHLKNQIEKINYKRKQRIEKYLKTNSIDSKYDSNGNKLSLYDVTNDGIPLYRITHNANSAIATRTNYLHNGGGLGLDLEGQNMTIGIWDGGSALETHNEFLDETGTTSRVTIGDFSTDESHATHVGGTLIARGVFGDAKGMAPKANLLSYNWDNDLTEVNSEAFNGLLVSNHSYGIQAFNDSGNLVIPSWILGAYTTDSATLDDLLYSYPYYLMVKSAGNNGNDDYADAIGIGLDKLSGDAVSKNNLVVANANNPTIDPASGEVTSLIINSSSSEGPTDDGRIKPDITGDGTNLLSCGNNTNFSYSNSTGTSMSSPNVAGSLILLQQYYNQLFGNYMRSATLKGLACHTADDDSNLIGPDYIFGWGLLNSKKAAETITNSQNQTALILESQLTNNGTFTYTFNASSPEPVLVSISWTDPAGNAQQGDLNSPTPALVNDLDLVVTDSQNTQFYPWKLDLSNLSGGAIKGDNTVDNFERVDIESPTQGVFTVTVSHKGQLIDDNNNPNPQNFSLIITGSNLSLLSTEEISTNDFVVWPNPATNKINFKFNKASKTEITMFDMLGRSVYNSTIDIQSSLNSGQIDTSNLESGVYLLKFIQGNNEVTKRIIIE